MADRRIRTASEPVRMAILGCGAVTELLHLPAVAEVAGLQVTLLVDQDLGRAKALANQFGIPAAHDSFLEVEREADAVLVALPNRLHAPVSIEYLTRGIPVLVEKPMALSAQEARAMVDAAHVGGEGAILQVALMKRFARGALAIKEVLDQGGLGTVKGFSIEWGEIFSWPLTSEAGMTRSGSGGGVLIDFGSHLLDLLCWWLGQPALVSYADDNRGGVEADCELKVSMEGRFGVVHGDARFSRLRRLGNSVRIWGDRGAIEWAHEVPDQIRFTTPTGVDEKSASAPEPYALNAKNPQLVSDLFVEQLSAFVQAVSGRGPSPVPGESVVPSVELIERCYRERRTIPEPWDRPVRRPESGMAGR